MKLRRNVGRSGQAGKIGAAAPIRCANNYIQHGRFDRNRMLVPYLRILQQSPPGKA
jgi:hypothetical protein